MKKWLYFTALSFLTSAQAIPKETADQIVSIINGPVPSQEWINCLRPLYAAEGIVAKNLTFFTHNGTFKHIDQAKDIEETLLMFKGKNFSRGAVKNVNVGLVVELLIPSSAVNPNETCLHIVAKIDED